MLTEKEEHAVKFVIFRYPRFDSAAALGMWLYQERLGRKTPSETDVR